MEVYDVEQVVQAVDALSFISQYVDLEGEGGEYFGKCCFHNENTPSFHFSEGCGLWHCFGCGAGGDIIEFVERIKGLRFNDAVVYLAKWGGISEQDQHKPIAASKVLRRYKAMAGRADERVIERTPIPQDIMSSFLSPDATPESHTFMETWRQEGIGDEAMSRFMVRYDPKTERIVFPIRQPDGKIFNIAGRTIYPQYKEKQIRKYTYLYKMGVLDTLYGLSDNLYNIINQKEVIVFEGAKSVMKAEGYGVYNSVAALTSRINSYQLKLLLKLGVKVVFAFDAEVRVSDIETIRKLSRFVTVEYITNKNGILSDKMAPVDAGKDAWEELYLGRERV